MNSRDIIGLVLLIFVITMSIYAYEMVSVDTKGPEKPIVHHMKEGFICITYRETMICGQGTNTRPSQSEESGKEEHSLLSQTTPTISYSVQF